MQSRGKNNVGRTTTSRHVCVIICYATFQVTIVVLSSQVYDTDTRTDRQCRSTLLSVAMTWSVTVGWELVVTAGVSLALPTIVPFHLVLTCGNGVQCSCQCTATFAGHVDDLVIKITFSLSHHIVHTVAYLRGHSEMALLASHTLFFYERSTDTVHGRLVRGLPLEASTSLRFVTYFKTVFQSAPKHVIFIQKIAIFFWRRGTAPPQTPLLAGGQTAPAPPVGAFAPLALNPCPFSKILNTPLCAQTYHISNTNWLQWRRARVRLGDT